MTEAVAIAVNMNHTRIMKALVLHANAAAVAIVIN